MKILKDGQHSFLSGRTLVWFSCGAASAVAAKLATEQFGAENLEILYCDLSVDEDEDNQRFRVDVENWINHRIKVISNPLFHTCDQVFEYQKYISGIAGAGCTEQLKKIPRIAYQWPEDVHVFGYPKDEEKRIQRFEENNPQLHCEWLLRDAGLTKSDCFEFLSDAGILVPRSYALGFKNANCKGCVKATSPHYWNLTRKHYPEAFALRAMRSRALGVRLVRYKGERIFLDELPPDSTEVVKENLSCGPQCTAPELTPTA